MNLTVIWRFMLRVCELMEVFLCVRKKYKNYAQNISRHRTKFSCSGELATGTCASKTCMKLTSAECTVENS